MDETQDLRILIRSPRGTWQAPARSVAAQPSFRYAEQIPFAGGLLHSRSVGLTAFAVANPFRNFPSCSNPKRLKCSSLPLF